MRPAGFPRSVAELAEAVLAADPGNADARYVRSRLLCENDQYAEALTIAEQLAAEGYPSAHMASQRPGREAATTRACWP